LRDVDLRHATRKIAIAFRGIPPDIVAMTTMIAEVYDALVAAGSPEEKARKAAEAVAAYDNRFGGIEQQLTKMDGDISQRFAKLEGDVNQRFAKIEGEIRLLSWMIGFNLAGTVGIIFMLLRH
jgi:hypothetical protein